LIEHRLIEHRLIELVEIKVRGFVGSDS